MTVPDKGVPEGRRLRVLITNRTLATRTGTELYVRDLAFGLAERGHSPIVYTPFLGEIAREIRAKAIPVTDDLLSIAEPPDVIHGHHSLETLAALLAFPDTPGISFCHSWDGWADSPLQFPRLFRYVAVDHTCRDRLQCEHGIPAERIELVFNSVDVARFRPRSPLPARPKRALVFSNAARSGRSHVPAIQAACKVAGIDVELAGSRSGKSLEQPEDVIGEFDIVFAKAKAAMEALAVGTAVILCDAAGAGPMVTTANFAQLRPLNFGRRALQQPPTAQYLGEQIAHYDPTDAAAVSRTLRDSARSDLMIAQLCDLYEEVIAQHAGFGQDDNAEGRAAAVFLQYLAPRMMQRDLLAGAFEHFTKMPLLGAMIHRAARAPRRLWLRELLRFRDLD